MRPNKSSDRKTNKKKAKPASKLKQRPHIQKVIGNLKKNIRPFRRQTQQQQTKRDIIKIVREEEEKGRKKNDEKMAEEKIVREELGVGHKKRRRDNEFQKKTKKTKFVKQIYTQTGYWCSL